MKNPLAKVGLVAATLGLALLPLTTYANEPEAFEDNSGEETIYVAPAPVAALDETQYPEYGQFAPKLNGATLDALDEAFHGQFPVAPLPEDIPAN